jgi:MoxR-like ATPase
VLISGEPGIGKTRLVEELAARANAAGARVLWATCWEDEGAPADWPWIQLLRGLAAAHGTEPVWRFYRLVP